MRYTIFRLSLLPLALTLAACGDTILAPDGGVPRPSFAHVPGEVGIPGLVLTGPGAGVGPQVSSFAGVDGSLLGSFFAYDPAFTGGVRVAAGDVNADGVPDVVTGTGPGAAAHVKVFDGVTGDPLMSFFAYDPAFTGGVYVAAGDVDGDGRADVITGAGAGAGPHVKVFSGADGSEIRSFFNSPASFMGGIRVAAGDVDGDGRADIVTGMGPGGFSVVRVHSGASGSELFSFFAYDFAFMGGVSVAAGDVTGDGFADIVTGAGPGGTAHVKVFSGAGGRLLSSFVAYDPAFLGGVHVGAADVDGDGHADVLTAPAGGAGPHVKVFSGATGVVVSSFFAYDPAFTGGVYVAGAAGMAVEEDATMEALREDAERAATDGRLEGAGSGAAGPGRLKAWLNMLRSAEELFAAGSDAEGCALLHDAWLRADGTAPPPDFVTGEAREELAERIEAVAAAEGCAPF